MTQTILDNDPKYLNILRVSPESSLKINNPETRMLVFYNRMLQNRVAQGLLTEEERQERHFIQCRKLADLPRKLPTILPGATEYEQACLLLDGE